MVYLGTGWVGRLCCQSFSLPPNGRCFLDLILSMLGGGVGVGICKPLRVWNSSVLAVNSVAASILAKKGALADFSFLLLLEIVKELKFLKCTERWWGKNCKCGSSSDYNLYGY